MTSLPRLHFAQKVSVVVVALSEIRTDAESVMFVPVRRITKGSVRFVRAYCGNVLHGSCHHTRTISHLLEDCGVSEEVESHATPDFAEVEDDEEISCLPLSPINCAKSVHVDENICRLAREGRAYILRPRRISMSAKVPVKNDQGKFGLKEL